MSGVGRSFKHNQRRVYDYLLLTRPSKIPPYAEFCNLTILHEKAPELRGISGRLGDRSTKKGASLAKRREVTKKRSFGNQRLFGWIGARQTAEPCQPSSTARWSRLETRSITVAGGNRHRWPPGNGPSNTEFGGGRKTCPRALPSSCAITSTSIRAQHASRPP